MLRALAVLLFLLVAVSASGMDAKKYILFYGSLGDNFPAGTVYLTDSDSAYVTDSDGAYITF
jgi:hypothetical protein